MVTTLIENRSHHGVRGNPGVGSLAPFSIGYVIHKDLTRDTRLKKISDRLTHEKFKTVIISANPDGRSRREKVNPYLDINRLPSLGSRSFRRFINFPAFFSPIWLSSIFRAVKKDDLKLIIVRDLPLALAAIWVGRVMRIPVILDMVHDYPARIKDIWEFRGPRISDVALRNPLWLRSLEKMVLNQVDGVLVGSQASADRVRRLARGTIGSTWLVRNTPRLQDTPFNLKSSLAFKLNGTRGLRLLYVGNFEENRGLDMAVSSIPHIIQRVGNAHLFIVGEGPFKNELKKQVERLHIDRHVTIAGPVPMTEIPSVIHEADIGLIPHFVTPHSQTMLPGMVFDFMAQAKPIVVTQSVSLVDVVKRYDCGRVYRDHDPRGLAAAVSSLSDLTTRRRLGINGAMAVRRELNWQHDSDTLIRAIRETVFRRQVN